MRWIDLPPFWLLVCLALVWLSPWALPWGASFWLGLPFLLAGAALTIAALVEFRRARTTVIPRQDPNALITGGVFRFSRNPIYLADVLVLLGFALIWGRVLGIVLVPIFVILLERRFIRGEEARLQDAFGEKFTAYAGQTRRWI